jgi:phosphoesterase RecJ-like protein
MQINNEFKKSSELIKKSKSIILVPHAKMDCDGMSATIALYLFLKKIGKDFIVAISKDKVPEAFKFLPSSNIFKKDINSLKNNKNKFIISINTSKENFLKVDHEILEDENKINLIIESKIKPFVKENFSFLEQSIEPDLIITLDSGDTNQLGDVYTENQDIFNNIPVINIDHHVSNTLFGDINIVDFKSSSTTELIYKLILSISSINDIDKDIATLILAGMLTDTGSFQHSNTTPEALEIASVLIEKGAEHQNIVKHLFKTKSLETLRIWGKVLSKLQNDKFYKMVWSNISLLDLDESRSHSDNMEGVIDELMATTPDTELVLLIKEREDNVISTSVRSSSKQIDCVEFTKVFGGGGHKEAAGFKIRDRGGKSFEEIATDIVYEAKKFQAKRLNIKLPKRDFISEIKEYTNNINESESESDSQIKVNSLPDFPKDEILNEELKYFHTNNQNLDNSLSENTQVQSTQNFNNQNLDNSLSENTQVQSTQNFNNQNLDNSLSENTQVQSTQNFNNQNLDNSLSENTQVQSTQNFNNQNLDNSLSENTQVQSTQNFNNQNLDNSLSENTQVQSTQNFNNQNLSPEEKNYINAKQYKIQEPEKEIEKKEDKYINDFTEFLSKSEDEESQEDSNKYYNENIPDPFLDSINRNNTTPL